MKTLTRAYMLLFAAQLLVAAAAHAQQSAPDSTAVYLRPGDVVRLYIWREEDLTGDFPVPESGVVVFPKIGPVKVTQTSVPALKEALRTEYLKYLRNPSIEITILRRVSILGAVREPGVYPIDETMSVSNVLALAGGATEAGKPDEVRLLRDGETLVTTISQKTRISDLPLRSGDQLWVPQRSWASRNTGFISALISGVLSVVIAIIVQNN